MNLFHLNIEVDSNVLRNADYDIRQYTDFIGKSIDLLKKETHAVKGIKKTVEGKKGKIRFEPETPENRKEEKAVELLFNENTKVIFDQKDCFNKEKSIRIDRQNEDENYITLETDIKGNIIFLRPDTYQLEQQKKALDNLRYKPLKEHQPLLNLFGYPDSPTWRQQCYNDNFDWTILTDETKDGIREQRKFVSKAVQTKDFALMEGPPGSGKTTTIIELIMQFASQGKRILLCSATHAAVDNVIERIKGRYRSICDKEIIPVRISRFEQPVKESVKPYLLQKLVNTYKSEIEKHLKKNNSLESQKFLLENIDAKTEQGSDPIEKIILDSANLVAGTMIGILQHPDIRANKQGASFDVLIVDEASKVTFSDFIVPALHAKKWILAGDVKQLSPYVENDYVSENIASMLPESKQQSIVKQFELKAKLDDKKFDDCLKVYFTDQNPNTEKQLIENRELVIETVGENWEANELNITKINSADIVIAKNDTKVKQLLSNNIQVKSIFINGETSGLLQPYRQNYFRQTSKKPLPYLFDSRQEEWAEMVSSRLSQSFSFRNAGEEFSNIDRELEYLIPCELKEKINQIRRLVFPSILELLQNGVGKGGKQRYDRVLSDGFLHCYKRSRFVSLSYQHRMHPDIAKTSKENFYKNNLRPANTVLEDRGWKYATNEPVVKWIHNNDKTGNIKGNKIINPTETNNIEKELSKFLEWAKNNPKENGEHYEVAVLTFYLNQATELRRSIRKITKQGHFSKFHKDNTDIFLYTVDKFQGQEADLVLLSFTKFTRDAHFNSPNRLNVALTRARHKLVLFGNKEWFKKKAKLKALRDLATKFESIIRYEK
jgi:superfamily I DNA and/or RNA helicase